VSLTDKEVRYINQGLAAGATRERLRISRAQRKALDDLRGLLESYFPVHLPLLASIDNATKAPRRKR